MSFPNIPDISPEIKIDNQQAVNLILASIALEEISLSHIINAEAEKIQYVLGTLEGAANAEKPPTIEDLLAINHSVDKTLKTIIMKQMLLEYKLEETISYSKTTTSTTSTTTTTTGSQPVNKGSAWSVGTDFGTGNAQYTTLEAGEEIKTVALGLGKNHIPIGTVHIERSGNNLTVTISTFTPYTMDKVHLYVGDTAPTKSNPGGFPYKYTVTDPNNYFDSHTFNIDISDLKGDTIYIAAHAHIWIV